MNYLLFKIVIAIDDYNIKSYNWIKYDWVTLLKPFSPKCSCSTILVSCTKIPAEMSIPGIKIVGKESKLFIVLVKNSSLLLKQCYANIKGWLVLLKMQFEMRLLMNW